MRLPDRWAFVPRVVADCFCRLGLVVMTASSAVAGDPNAEIWQAFKDENSQPKAKMTKKITVIVLSLLLVVSPVLVALWTRWRERKASRDANRAEDKPNSD